MLDQVNYSPSAFLLSEPSIRIKYEMQRAFKDGELIHYLANWEIFFCQKGRDITEIQKALVATDELKNDVQTKNSSLSEAERRIGIITQILDQTLLANFLRYITNTAKK